MALHSAGKVDEAIAVLAGNLDRHTGDLDTLWALFTICRDAGRSEEAEGYAQRFAELAPRDPRTQAL